MSYHQHQQSQAQHSPYSSSHFHPGQQSMSSRPYATNPASSSAYSYVDHQQQSPYAHSAPYASHGAYNGMGLYQAAPSHSAPPPPPPPAFMPMPSDSHLSSSQYPSHGYSSASAYQHGPPEPASLYHHPSSAAASMQQGHLDHSPLQQQPPQAMPPPMGAQSLGGGHNGGGNGAGHSMSGGMRPKRRQVKNACVNCQKACKKCDEGRPCGRCIKYGLTNSCADSMRKERKRGIKRGPYKRRSGTNGVNGSTSAGSDGAGSQPSQHLPQGSYHSHHVQQPYIKSDVYDSANASTSSYDSTSGYPGTSYRAMPAYSNSASSYPTSSSSPSLFPRDQPRPVAAAGPNGNISSTLGSSATPDSMNPQRGAWAGQSLEAPQQQHQFQQQSTHQQSSIPSFTTSSASNSAASRAQPTSPPSASFNNGSGFASSMYAPYDARSATTSSLSQQQQQQQPQQQQQLLPMSQSYSGGLSSNGNASYGNRSSQPAGNTQLSAYGSQGSSGIGHLLGSGGGGGSSSSSYHNASNGGLSRSSTMPQNLSSHSQYSSNGSSMLSPSINGSLAPSSAASLSSYSTSSPRTPLSANPLVSASDANGSMPPPLKSPLGGYTHSNSGLSNGIYQSMPSSNASVGARQQQPFPLQMPPHYARAGKNEVPSSLGSSLNGNGPQALI